MMSARIPARLGAAMLLVAVLCAPANAVPEPTDTIVVKDFLFQPMLLAIKAGTTVTWSNRDEEPHTISATGLFRSGALDTNQSFSFRFDKPGTFHFTCSIHPQMTGTILVQ